MNASSMAADLSGYSWRRAFADAMIQIRPDINPDAADELSDSAFLRLRNLPPKRAAEIYSKVGHAWYFQPGDSA